MMTPEVVGGGESRSAREAAREDAIGFCVVMGWPYNPRTIKALTALLESHAALREAAAWAEARKIAIAAGHSGMGNNWNGACHLILVEINAAAGGGTVRPGQEGAE